MKHENVSLVLSSGQMPNCLIQCDQYTAFFHRQSEQTGIGNLPVPVNPVLERSSQADLWCRMGQNRYPGWEAWRRSISVSLLHGQSADCRTGYDAQEACLCEKSADAPVPGAFIVEPSCKSGMVNIAQASSSIVIVVLIIEIVRQLFYLHGFIVDAV